MRSSRKALRVSVLVLALTSSALAGEMQHPVAPPAPPTATGEMPFPAPSNGVMHTGGAESAPGAAEALTQAALNLLRSVLSIL